MAEISGLGGAGVAGTASGCVGSARITAGGVTALGTTDRTAGWDMLGKT
jgi:hypothetical protein